MPSSVKRARLRAHADEWSGDAGPAAIDAVKQWRYKPYLLNGDPIELDTTVEVKFTLGG